MRLWPTGAPEAVTAAAIAGAVATVLVDPRVETTLVPIALALGAVAAAAAADVYDLYDAFQRAFVAVTLLLAAGSLWSVSVPNSYFLPVLVAFLLWPVALLAWLVELVLRACRSRAWTWGDVARRAAIPVLAIATYVAADVDAPMKARFLASLPAMNDAAHDVAEGLDPAEIDRIGLWSVERARRTQGGFEFTVADSGVLGAGGFAYARSSPPADPRYEHLRGSWYVVREQGD